MSAASEFQLAAPGVQRGGRLIGHCRFSLCETAASRWQSRRHREERLDEAGDKIGRDLFRVERHPTNSVVLGRGGML